MNRTFFIALILLISSNLDFGQISSSPTKISSDSKKEITIEKKQSVLEASISERFFTTTIIISETILLLFIVGYWRKTRIDYKNDNKSIFKKNITALRLERIRRFENKKLSMIRKTLYSKINQTSIDGKFITSRAKKMEVSKGEIFLAAKIKQLSKQAI